MNYYSKYLKYKHKYNKNKYKFKMQQGGGNLHNNIELSALINYDNNAVTTFNNYQINSVISFIDNFFISKSNNCDLEIYDVEKSDNLQFSQKFINNLHKYNKIVIVDYANIVVNTTPENIEQCIFDFNGTLSQHDIYKLTGHYNLTNITPDDHLLYKLICENYKYKNANFANYEMLYNIKQQIYPHLKNFLQVYNPDVFYIFVKTGYAKRLLTFQKNICKMVLITEQHNTTIKQKNDSDDLLVIILFFYLHFHFNNTKQIFIASFDKYRDQENKKYELTKAFPNIFNSHAIDKLNFNPETKQPYAICQYLALFKLFNIFYVPNLEQKIISQNYCSDPNIISNWVVNNDSTDSVIVESN